MKRRDAPGREPMSGLGAIAVRAHTRNPDERAVMLCRRWLGRLPDGEDVVEAERVLTGRRGDLRTHRT